MNTPLKGVRFHLKTVLTHRKRANPKGLSMNKTLLALYGLKWNRFSPELPTEALFVPPKVEDFFSRIEQAHVREGGFALIHGDAGTGKSVVLRLLAERLERLPDVTVAVLSHPQSNLADAMHRCRPLRSVQRANRQSRLVGRASPYRRCLHLCSLGGSRRRLGRRISPLACAR